MDWQPEAETALQRVPRLVRGLARRKIEEMVTGEGRGMVTFADFEAAYSKFRRKKDTGSQLDLDEEQVKELEQKVQEIQNLPAMQTRYYSIRQCGASAGCPRARVEISQLTERLQQVLDDGGLDRFLQERIKGPILTHNKFRVALCGCPNSCSQPQIVDFGVIGQARPARGTAECSQCGACVDICTESAIQLTDEGPVFDWERCILCGDCTDVCPIEAIVIGTRSFSVVVGGRLGRHPKLATPLLNCVDEDTVVHALQKCLHFYMSNAQGAEKFSAVVERIGVRELYKKLSAP